MSIRQAYKDYLTITTIFGVAVLLVILFRQYFQTSDVRLLYLGLTVIVISVFGVIARYFYVIDYIWTLLKSWK